MTKSNLAFLSIGIVLGIVATLAYINLQSSARNMKKMEFGIPMTKEDGVSNFGVDEIQARLKEGAVITGLQSKGASFQKTGEVCENVSLYFSGGAFEIELKDDNFPLDPKDANNAG